MKLHILLLKNTPIYEQLQLEEALLRTDNRNWFILNVGSPPSIVMGLNTQPEDVIFVPQAKETPLPVVRRFSGGGTVIVDEDTLFTTFLLQAPDHNIHPYPQDVLSWTGEFYRSALHLPQLSVQDSDYVLANRKVGGNAQYFRKNCFLHHSTFLYDFQNRAMTLLKLPSRQPAYRQNREHNQFLTTLKPLMTKEEFQKRLLSNLSKKYSISIVDPKSLNNFPSHRKTTAFVAL